MPLVRIKDTDEVVQFPDDMRAQEILSKLREYRPPNYSDALQKPPSMAVAYEPTLAEKMGQGISNALYDSGIISNRFAAQNIGRNATIGAEFMPVIGDALGADELGRAIKEGDATGIGLGALSMVPVVGDLAKKLPSKGKVITDFYELFEYTPEQLAIQAKFSDPDNVIDGVYTINKGKFRTEYYDDGTSAIIINSDGRKIREFNQNETKDSLKNKILEAEAKRPEAVEIELRKQKAREQAVAAESAKDSYKIQHTAPMREDNSSGYDVSMSFGDDIYSDKALRFFGTGSSYDQKALNIIHQMKGNPEKNLIIYRAVPKSINEINKGDWVTTTREYAKDHATGEDGWHIISKRVKAKDIATDGNSIHEFGYDPLEQ
jgi:hypothetical protein